MGQKAKLEREIGYAKNPLQHMLWCKMETHLEWKVPRAGVSLRSEAPLEKSDMLSIPTDYYLFLLDVGQLKRCSKASSTASLDEQVLLKQNLGKSQVLNEGSLV